MATLESVAIAAEQRIEKQHDEITQSLEYVTKGNPLAAEPDIGRLEDRLRAKTQFSRPEAEALASSIHMAAESTDEERLGGPERIYGSTIDFVDVSFFDVGRARSRAVARVASRTGAAIGSGFMISEDLFLTNNHVMGSGQDASRMMLEFDYEVRPDGSRAPVTRFELDPSKMFLTDETNDLDFTVVAVGRRIGGTKNLDQFGWCGLSGANDKHALGEVANIIQHPDGRYKEVVLRENRLISRMSTVLHYVADTEPGSSGSPIFNNEWLVIALHHWGSPWRQRVDDAGKVIPREVNEGIRTSAIVRELERRAGGLDSDQRAMIQRVFNLGESARTFETEFSEPPAVGEHDAKIDKDGNATWTIPLELSVRLPSLGVDEVPEVPKTLPEPVGMLTERAVSIDTDYDNRTGFKRRFIPGFPIGLPTLSDDQEQIAARNKEAETGDDPFELKYQHFSVVMNRERRLSFFTACNIDGKTAKNVNRKTGIITAAGESAEAREKWFSDRRIDNDEQTNQDLYDRQKIRNVSRGVFLKRMFQRGHMVRRQDPSWGSDRRADRANADTFHFTNCAPQVGLFNTGRGDDDDPGNGKLWRVIEDYVRDNAVAEDQRVVVFTGPVFRNNDPYWRNNIISGFRVPRRFWKIVAWKDGANLRSTAMIADQSEWLDSLPEGLSLDEAGPEAFDDRSEVKDFLTTVRNIERITNLTFDAAIRKGDLSIKHDGGAESIERELWSIKSFEEIRIKPETAKRKTARK